MAYVPKSLSMQSEDPTRIDVTGAGAGSGGGSAQVSGAFKAPSSSSGQFTNIGDYLKANQTGASRLGTQVAGNINKETDEAKTAIQTGQNQFNTAADANKIAYDHGAVQRFTGTGATTNDFSRLLSGTYGGPNSLADVGARTSIDKEVSEANQKAQLAGTQGGQIQLIRDVAGRPVSTGALRLNSALITGNEGAQTALRSATAGASGLNTSLTAAEQAAQQRAAEVRALNKNTKAKTLESVNSYLDTQDSALAQRLAQAKIDAEAKNSAAQAYLRNPSSGTAAGLSAEQNAQLQAALAAAKASGASTGDLSKYYTAANPNQLTRESVTSADEAKRLTNIANVVNRGSYGTGGMQAEGQFNIGGALSQITAAKEAADRVRAAETARLAAEAKAAADAKAKADAAAQAAREQNAMRGSQVVQYESYGGGDSAGEGGGASDGGIGGTAGSGNDGGDSGGDAGTAAGDAGSTGDSGGGGGGGKIICTMMNDFYGLPYNENKVWLKYAATHLKPEHQRGYHAVFLPLVAFAKRPGYLNTLVRNALFYIGKHRTIDIQAELAGTYRRPVHKFLRAVIEPALAFIGKFLK